MAGMNPQKRSCLVCGLTSTKTLAFPQGTSERDKKRYGIWLEFCKKYNPPKERLMMKHKRLCTLHFEDKYLRHPCRKYKMKESIPTLPGDSSSEIFQDRDPKSSSSIPEITDLTNEESEVDTNSSRRHRTSCGIWFKETNELDSVQIPDTSISHDSDIENNFTLSESQPLLQEVTSTPEKLVTRVIKVLGQHNLKDPSVIKSLLDKVKFKKRGSVYVLPLKKKYNINKLTKNYIRNIIENSPTVENSLKNRLLKILKCKNVPFKRHIQDTSISKRKHIRSRKAGQCTCPVHCTKGKCRNHKCHNFSPGLHIKIDGCDLRGNAQDCGIFNGAENFFTVSSVLTNINDKYQLERVCQLVIETIFKLKNVNVNGTMSKIEIFLSQNPEVLPDIDPHSNGTAPETPFTSEALGATKTNSSQLFCGTNSYKNNNVPQVNETHITQDQDKESSDITLSTSLKSNFLPHLEDNNLNKPLPECSASSSSTPKNNESGSQNFKKSMKVDLNFYHDHSYLSYDSQVLFQKPPYLVNLVNIDTYRSSSKKTRIMKRPLEASKKVQKEFQKLHRQINRLKGLVKRKNENIDKINVKLKYLKNKVCEELGLKHIRYPKARNKADSVSLLEAGEDTSGSTEKGKKITNKKDKKIKKNILAPDFQVSPIICHNLETPGVEYRDKCEYLHDTY